MIFASYRSHFPFPLPFTLNSTYPNTAGKLLLVLNLRYLDQFLHAVRFKYEDLHIAALMFKANEYLFKFT